MNVETSVGRESRSSGSVQQQLVDAVGRSDVRHKPFDHIYMEDVLDGPSYRALLAGMPDRSFYHYLKHRDALRPDGTSTRLRLYL